MRETFEIRTIRGTPVLSFDNEQRARRVMAERQKKIGAKMLLVRVTQQEELLS